MFKSSMKLIRFQIVYHQQLSAQCSNVLTTRLKAKNSSQGYYYAEQWRLTLLWPRSPISATAELQFFILAAAACSTGNISIYAFVHQRVTLFRTCATGISISLCAGSRGQLYSIAQNDSRPRISLAIAKTVIFHSCYCPRMLCGDISFTVFVCFCELRRQQNRRTLAAGISQRGCQNGTKFCRLIEGTLLYIITQPGEFSPRGGLERQNSEGCKTCRPNAFLVHCLSVCPSAMKFGTMTGIVRSRS